MSKGKPRARPLLVYALALAAAMTVPPMILAVVATSNWVAAERARLRLAMDEAVDRALAQVDRFLDSKAALLQALATSPAIDQGDLARLDAQARQLLRPDGLNIVLRDGTGQQFLNTRVPYGTPLPKGTVQEEDRIVVEARRPVISNLYPGVLGGIPLIRVIVPVVRDGEVRYTLTASLPTAGLARLIESAGIGAPLSGGIADRNGVILARTPHDERLIGARLPGFHEAGGRAGSWTGVNSRGVLVEATYRRSAMSDWLFTIGIDKAVLDAPLWKSVLSLVALAIALGLIAFGVSSRLVGQVLASNRALEGAAEALGNGELVVAPATSVEEANTVGRAIAAASTRIHEQAAALLEANRDLERRVEERTAELSRQTTMLRATLDNMDQGLIMVDADGRAALCNARALKLLELPEDLMAGKPLFSDVLRHQFDHREFAAAEPELRRWLQSGGLAKVAHTYERERPNGVVLEIRTVPLEDGGAVRTYTDITARKSAERSAQHMAHHDGLTGLPNRTLFWIRIEEALTDLDRAGAAFAVLCLDLDEFKAVNDTLGHPAGDALLRIVADRIVASMRPGDVVARLGGDEFSVLQTSGDQPLAAQALAQRLIEVLRRPFDLDGHMIHIGASVGIAIAPAAGATADDVFRSADLALYAAKNEGRNRFRLYEPAMDLALQARQALEADLRRALSAGEFELHYQPVIDLRHDKILGFEALLRWRHPEKGLIAPADFIPVAEESRLIVPIGAWALREACREATQWPAGTRLLVNMSPIQVEDPSILNSVLSAIAASGLLPPRLQLEITETVLLRDNEVVLKALGALREIGVRIALDDFGTGYSSLGYLRRFPLDAVKIDRSFVQGYADPATGAIFRAILALGQGLGMSVTAEGVETAEQLDHVRKAGCTEVQGFLFSRPVPAAEARRLLTQPMIAAA